MIAGARSTTGRAPDDLRIDQTLRALIPPLNAAEHRQLEASLVVEGCRDPIVVWKGRNLVLDGHNRLEICREHGIPFRVIEYAPTDEQAARWWVIHNQLARRNLTPFQKAELALALLPEASSKARERQRGGGRSKLPLKSAEASEALEELAARSGVSRDTLRKALRVQEHADDELKAELRSGEISIHKAYQRVRRDDTEREREAAREDNQRRVQEAAALDDTVPDGCFSAVVVDPPWRYGDDWDPYGRGRPEYATMGIDELRALPVSAKAAENAHLYLWTTSRLLPAVFELVEAWGFEYRGLLTWCKPGLGMGHAFRSTTEHIVFGVRGSLPLERKDQGTWFQAPRGRHSEKPAEFYDLVESCSPGPYLDVFARAGRDGWTVWGGEL